MLPEDARRREAFERSARRLFDAAGYERIETPTFELTELFARGVGDATDVVQKEMYTFDDGGGRSMTLRPEGTAPVCRAYLEHGMHKLPQPVRLWYLSSFFRHEAPQAGRYRQFWQVGVEAIGSDDPAVDAEVIVLLAELLAEMGVPTRLRLSSLGMPETRAAYREELQAYLRAHSGELASEVRERIDAQPAARLRLRPRRDAGGDGERAAAARPPGARGPRALRPRCARCSTTSGFPTEVDPTLVRGLDYYTRTVFEFTSERLGAQSGVGGGGRYDRLIEQLGGSATPGVGWAAGVERIFLAGDPPPTAPPPVDLFVAHAKPELHALAFRMATDARRAGLGAQAELAGRGLKGQMKHADRLGARFVAILGDEGASLKDMESGEQRELEPGQVIPTVQRGGAP